MEQRLPGLGSATQSPTVSQGVQNQFTPHTQILGQYAGPPPPVPAGEIVLGAGGYSFLSTPFQGVPVPSLPFIVIVPTPIDLAFKGSCLHAYLIQP